MTEKFEKAKAEIIQKYNRILEAVRLAKNREVSRCSFCRAYGNCEECPVNELCVSELHLNIIIKLKDVEEKVIEGISLLEKVEEKQPK